MKTLHLSRAKPWVQAYKWPIYCFIAVAFWNLVGAGLFGFFINPPIALYYMQGLNTTAVHGHTALFGVYGVLGIGLMLFCLKGLTGQKNGKQKCLVSLLGDQYWTCLNGTLEFAACWSFTNLGQCRARNVVCTICRLLETRLCPNICMVKNDW